MWYRLYNAAVAEGIQISGHFRKPDAAIYWLCVCRRTMTKSGNRSALGRTDASASCFRDGRSWRNLRLQPKTAFLRFPAVHRADLEGQQRVDSGHPTTSQNPSNFGLTRADACDVSARGPTTVRFVTWAAGEYDIFLANIRHMFYLCSECLVVEQKENAQMSVFAEPIPPAQVRDRSIEARRAARLARAQRERRIVDLLNRGVTVAEIAAREEVTEKRMRALISEILARRMPQPPAEFLALQVSRLNEALLVAYGAMSGGNLRAVDHVVKIVRELDRYHGFFAAGRRVLPDAPRLEQQDCLALAAPLTDRPQLPSCDASACHPRESGGPDRQPQASPTGSHVTPMSAAVRWTPVFTGVTMDASDPQDAAPMRETFAPGLETPAQEPLAVDAPLTNLPDMAPQAAEKAQIPPGNGAAPDASDPQDAAPMREAFASGLETPAQESLVFDAPPTNCPETAPQAVEKAQIPPGNGRGGTWARPPGGASVVGPAVASSIVASPAAFRRVNVRATRNGMAAC